ncbi:MAG: 50S ribosomal protein L19 [Chloroflexi bacterium]|nr:50S ribosomal protein L19 [Chloroflexota bacterium]
MNNLLRAFDAPANPNVPELRSGDNVSVHVRFKEGENERTQVYKGTVIRVRGSQNDATFTVRRIASNGIGVERTFLMRSPSIDKVTVHRRSDVRRSRLYYLRERSGKSARLKQKFAK